MQLNECLNWHIEFAALYARKTAASELPQVRASAAFYEAKRDGLRGVQAALQSGATMSPEAVKWSRWLMDTVATWQNNPRIFEAHNDAVRIAATAAREAA